MSISCWCEARREGYNTCTGHQDGDGQSTQTIHTARPRHVLANPDLDYLARSTQKGQTWLLVEDAPLGFIEMSEGTSSQVTVPRTYHRGCSICCCSLTHACLLVGKMKRVFGAVSNALRSLAPKASIPAVPHVAHQERVRQAMDSLAPEGRRLPSEGKALAIELLGAAGKKDLSLETPEDIYQAANTLFQVRPAEQAGQSKLVHSVHIHAS